MAYADHQSRPRCPECGAIDGHFYKCGLTGIEVVTKQTGFYKELLDEAEKKGQWNLLAEYKANGFDVTEDYRVMLKYLRDLPGHGDEPKKPELNRYDERFMAGVHILWDEERAE